MPSLNRVKDIHGGNYDCRRGYKIILFEIIEYIKCQLLNIVLIGIGT